MDIVIIVGIALLVIVVLLVTRGKKPDSAELPAAPSREPKRTAETASAPQQEEAEEDVRAEPAAVPEPEPSEPEAEEPKAAAPRGDIPGMRKGLAKSRESSGFFGRLKALFTDRAEISPELTEAIEEVLLASDVGTSATAAILENVRSGLDKGQLKSESAVWDALRREATQLLQVGDTQAGLALLAKPSVVLMVGVNGAGKTTTIGKLATKLQAQGKTCVLAAGDTFRAAAVQQLLVWGKRIGCEVVKGKDGADPGSVVFDAVKRAQEVGADVVLADTAGRLHTKTNLMSEMQKIQRTLGKAMDGAPHETLLVIDATNGQNAIAQAKEFKETLPLTGIVLTKLDGTAKGGFVLGITATLGLPVRYVGLGERPDDLHEFVAGDFVEALLGRDG
jgi:fused signal recognition particle receptor